MFNHNYLIKREGFTSTPGSYQRGIMLCILFRISMLAILSRVHYLFFYLVLGYDVILLGQYVMEEVVERRLLRNHQEKAK